MSNPTLETKPNLQSKASTPTTLKINLRDQLFQKRLAELRTFHAQHGHGSIPTPYPLNPPLGIWAANLRRQYALRQRAEEQDDYYNGYLTSSRQDQLLAVGFDFSSLTERQFQLRLEELEDFKGRYGHCMVPEKWEGNMALGVWVSNIRSLYKRKMEQDERPPPLQNNEKRKKGQSRKKLLSSKDKERQRSPRFSNLDDQRIQLLEDMGFVWSSTDRKWLEMLEWAKYYGVVRYETTKLEEYVNNDTDVSLLEGGDGDSAVIQVEKNGTKKYNETEQTLLIANYKQFVRNIQDQSLLPSFIHKMKYWRCYWMKRMHKMMHLSNVSSRQ